MLLSLLYNLLWYPAFPFALIAAGGGDPVSSRERLGVAAPRLSSPDLRLWAHASSVGEIEAIHPIVNRLLRETPGSEAVVTSMTAAGRDVARRRIPKARGWFLSPLDCSISVGAFLRRVRPTLVLIAETELWPNYFLQARRRGAKIAIVNGRISERSLGRYRRMRPLFAEALRCADLVMAQTEGDAIRFADLGVEVRRIFVTGNTKFDPDAGAEMPLRRELREFASERPILIAGSTAPGEEEAVLAAYQKLKIGFPALALILAPRHLARVPEVEKMLNRRPLGYIRASVSGKHGAADVMILDTMGELRALYRRAAVAFVGGTLDPDRGGQNPAEAASASVPVLLGPHHENQREITSALVSDGGARIVNNSDEIARAAGKWLANEDLRSAAGRSARECIQRQNGGVGATLMRLRSLINLA